MQNTVKLRRTSLFRGQEKHFLEKTSKALKQFHPIEYFFHMVVAREAWTRRAACSSRKGEPPDVGRAGAD